MQSDELFPTPPDAPNPWPELERRINRLLEGIVQLRNANAQLMKENVLLRNQLKEKLNEPDNGSAEELQKLKKQYEEALKDLNQVKQNLQRIDALARDLKLEYPETTSEAGT